MHLITRRSANVSKLDNIRGVANRWFGARLVCGHRKASLRISRAKLLFFLTLYYQNTKVERKNCQLSLNRLGRKWFGMLRHYFG
jgi:hypothetical protein